MEKYELSKYKMLNVHKIPCNTCIHIKKKGKNSKMNIIINLTIIYNYLIL